MAAALLRTAVRHAQRATRQQQRAAFSSSAATHAMAAEATGSSSVVAAAAAAASVAASVPSCQTLEEARSLIRTVYGCEMWERIQQRADHIASAPTLLHVTSLFQPRPSLD